MKTRMLLVLAIAANTFTGSVRLKADQASPTQQPNPRQQPGAQVTMFAPEQHDLYDGHYILSANRIYMVGGLNDAPGWDHLDNDAATVKPVAGSAEIDVDELKNTGTFAARLKIPEGDLVLAMDRFHEFNPCQNGGIAGFLHEHGTDSGCGDTNWPKAFGYLAGLGYGCDAERQSDHDNTRALHGDAGIPIEDLKVNYPGGQEAAGGEVKPATTDRLLHPKPADQPEEQTQPRSVRALLRHGSDLEVIRPAIHWSSVTAAERRDMSRRHRPSARTHAASSPWLLQEASRP